MTAVAVQRYSAKSTTVASAAGVNLNSLHLGPSPRPLTVAGRFSCSAAASCQSMYDCYNPYPTRESRRDAVRAWDFDVVLSDAARAHPHPGVAGPSYPSVSADVLFSECGQPVFDAGDRSRAVLVVLFVAQQRGQGGGVGESLHRRRDFAHGQVVVIVDR